MQVHFKAFVALSFGAGLISAQSFSVSSSCSDALKGLVTSPDAACLNPASLLNFAISTGQSIPDTINNWLTGVCSSGSCTNDSLASIVSQLTQGCSQELSSVGMPVTAAEITNIVQQVYPTVRKIACLQDESTNQLCVTQTFTSVQNAVSQLNLNITNFSLGNIIGEIKSLLTNINIQSLACTNCTKEAFTIALGDFPSQVSVINPEVQAVCGASFTDGNLPDAISQTAASGVFSADKQGSGALGVRAAFGGIGLGLLGLASLILI